MIKKILVGLMAGIISGLFTAGGGLILVPAFLYTLKMEPKQARATSIFCILPMVIASSFFYYKNDFINWNIALLCAIGGIAGGIIGAHLLKKIPDYIIKIAFTCFLVYVSITMIW